MRWTIDDSYGVFVRSLPNHLRAEANDLPYRLGLAKQSGGLWEDFVRMDPNRDLPRYAAEDPARPGHIRLPANKLKLYLRAHHYAAVFGLIADRIADGQTKKRASLIQLRDSIFQSWTETLAEATGSKRRASSLTHAALRALKKGNQAERFYLSRAARKGPKCLPIAAYVQMTCAKLRWFGQSAHGLLLSEGDPLRAMALRRVYDIFSVGLQCIDDALDEEADTKVRGASFPMALGLPKDGLLAASVGLFALAHQVAKDAKLHELSAWLLTFTESSMKAPTSGNAKESAQAAIAICRATREVLL